MKAELLAPAGSYEGLQAVVKAGADAVYIGGSMFGARAYANNPQQDEMLEAIDYAHIHGKQIYLTVNTLLKNKELYGQLYDFLAPYYQQGIDAVIVQDLGVLSFLKKEFPNFPIHASTQMAVTGARGAALLKEAGVSRIVTARELSLRKFMKFTRKQGWKSKALSMGRFATVIPACACSVACWEAEAATEADALSPAVCPIQHIKAESRLVRKSRHIC